MLIILPGGLAVSGLVAFATLTKSLQLISPNLVSSLRTLELVLAFLVQSLLTGVSPSLPSCLGGGAILSGVLLLALQASVLRSHWSSSNEALLSLVESFIVLLLPPILCHKEPVWASEVHYYTTRGFGTQTITLRLYFMA